MTANRIVIGHTKEGASISVSADDPEAIEKALTMVEQDMLKIREQLSEARAKVHTSGIYADPDWYVKANNALRFKGSAHQQLLRRLAELRRTKRQEEWKAQSRGTAAKASAFHERFVEVARRVLTEDTFQMIWKEAEEGVAIP